MTVVEASERYAHPRNAALLKFLEQQGVKGKSDVYDLEGYELHTHPDLCDHLQAFNRYCYAGAYGVPLLANDRGIIFGIAMGTSFVAFRLDEPERSEAKAAGGADFAHAGDGWVSVPAWRTESAVMEKWCRAAHALANSIKE